MNRNKNEGIDSVFDNLLNESFKFIGKGALVNFHEYYRAIYDTVNDKYSAFVCLVNLKGDKDFNFGYKSMSEDMGPVIDNCPKRILEIIDKSKPINDCASEWRSRCWNNVNSKKVKNSLQAGTIISFKNAITFTNGMKEKDFVVFEKPNKRKTKGLKSLHYGFVCRIPKWEYMPIEIR